jgi:hypothetical protein
MPRAAQAGKSEQSLRWPPAVGPARPGLRREARLAYVPRYVLAMMPGSAAPRMLAGMPEPAPPRAQVSEPGQNMTAPAAAAADCGALASMR